MVTPDFLCSGFACCSQFCIWYFRYLPVSVATIWLRLIVLWDHVCLTIEIFVHLDVIIYGPTHLYSWYFIFTYLLGILFFFICLYCFPSHTFSCFNYLCTRLYFTSFVVLLVTALCSISPWSFDVI